MENMSLFCGADVAMTEMRKGPAAPPEGDRSDAAQGLPTIQRRKDKCLKS